MKKLLLTVLLTLTISTSCFAEGAASRFATEEKAADTLIAAVTGNTVTYDAASRNFIQGLKTNLPADKFTAYKNDIKTKIGTIKNPNFIQLIKVYNFEKGYTGYNGRVDKKASGIGLYLCKGVCNKLGHGIRIESELGKGTDVIITVRKEAVNTLDSKYI